RPTFPCRGHNLLRSTRALRNLRALCDCSDVLYRRQRRFLHQSLLRLQTRSGAQSCGRAAQQRQDTPSVHVSLHTNDYDVATGNFLRFPTSPGTQRHGKTRSFMLLLVQVETSFRFSGSSRIVLGCWTMQVMTQLLHRIPRSTTPNLLSQL
ncbi:hypothetical protein PMAYCL1PPCAC_16241, partial [Pristionchus mayeri]